MDTFSTVTVSDVTSVTIHYDSGHTPMTLEKESSTAKCIMLSANQALIMEGSGGERMTKAAWTTPRPAQQPAVMRWQVPWFHCLGVVCTGLGVLVGLRM